MLNIDIDYTKADIARQLNQKIKSNIIRIEGKNESGKTLFLEVIANMFYLDPTEIKDESLREYYTGFINQDQKQKFKFSAELQSGGLTIVSSKAIGEKQPEIKINGERKAVNQIREKFHVYFDSIKSPKDQANEYKSECEREILYMERNVDTFHTYISSIESRINDYTKANGIITERTKTLEKAKKQLEEIKEKKPKITGELEYLKRLQIAQTIIELRSEIESLTKNLESIKEKIKSTKEESKNEKAASSEVIEAHSTYRSLINRLDKSVIRTELPKDIKFLFQLKLNSSLQELEVARKNLARIKAELAQQLNRLKNTDDYSKLEFINRLRAFILENRTNFKQTYPEFYEKIEEDHKKLKNVEEQVILLDKQCTNIDGIYNTINVYVSVLTKTRFNPIYITSDNGNLNDVKQGLSSSLAEKQKECDKEVAKLGDDLESLIEKAEKYKSEKLNSDILQKDSEIKGLEEQRISAEAERRTADTLIKENEGIIKNPPAFLDDIKYIQKLKATSGHVINKVGDVKSVINKIVENKTQNLTTEEKQIAKDIGKYFGQYQIDILHNYKVRKVKEIDLINGEYVLDDNTIVNFRTNSGKILVNTLLARIRNLPSNKKSILLIDEVSPLDSDNIDLLQNEIKKEMESGNVLLAVIAFPGNHYADKELHIIEV